MQDRLDEYGICTVCDYGSGEIDIEEACGDCTDDYYDGLNQMREDNYRDDS